MCCVCKARAPKRRAAGAVGMAEPVVAKKAFTGKCFNCGEKSHMSAECPKPKKVTKHEAGGSKQW